MMVSSSRYGQWLLITGSVAQTTLSLGSPIRIGGYHFAQRAGDAGAEQFERDLETGLDELLRRYGL